MVDADVLTIQIRIPLRFRFYVYAGHACAFVGWAGGFYWCVDRLSDLLDDTDAWTRVAR